MKKINLFLTLGIALFFFGQINAQPPKCDGEASDVLEFDIGELHVPATTAAEARQYLASMILLNTDVVCDRCPLPSGERCELKFDSWSIRPDVSKLNDSTYKAKEQTLKFRLKCMPCIMPKIVAAISDPLNGTVAVCGGPANVVTLSMPAVVIFNPNGDPMDIIEAMDYWRTMIILDNGNFIEGSAPWGCAMTQCLDMGYEGGCAMSILESSDIPEAEFHEETQGWYFAATEFTMAYSCSACGADGEGGGDDDDDNGVFGKTIQRQYAPASSIDKEGLIQQMFPNPASDHLTVTLGAIREKAVVSIVDITGKVVFSSTVNASQGQKAMLQIDVTNLASGIYHLNVASEGRQSSREFVVD